MNLRNFLIILSFRVPSSREDIVAKEGIARSLTDKSSIDVADSSISCGKYTYLMNGHSLSSQMKSINAFRVVAIE